MLLGNGSLVGRAHDPATGRLAHVEVSGAAPLVVDTTYYPDGNLATRDEPLLGRSEVIGQSDNWYAHVMNDPLRHVDPSGFQAEGVALDGLGMAASTAEPVTVGEPNASEAGAVCARRCR